MSDSVQNGARVTRADSGARLAPLPAWMRAWGREQSTRSDSSLRESSRERSAPFVSAASLRRIDTSTASSAGGSASEDAGADDPVAALAAKAAQFGGWFKAVGQRVNATLKENGVLPPSPSTVSSPSSPAPFVFWCL